MTIGDTPTANTEEALAMLEDVSARARAMKLWLVAYPVEDVEAVCAALRAVRNGQSMRIMDGGHCDLAHQCQCGGDTPEVRATCHNWIK